MKDDDKQVLDSSLESFANALRENDSKQIKLMQKFFPTMLTFDSGGDRSIDLLLGLFDSI